MNHKLSRIWHEKNKRSWVQSEGAKEGERFVSALQVELQVNAEGLKWMLMSAQWQSRNWGWKRGNIQHYLGPNIYWWAEHGVFFPYNYDLKDGASCPLFPNSHVLILSSSDRILMCYLPVITIILPLCFQYILLAWIMSMYVDFDFFYLQ